jgi:hypothetical protein
MKVGDYIVFYSDGFMKYLIAHIVGVSEYGTTIDYVHPDGYAYRSAYISDRGEVRKALDTEILAARLQHGL